MIRTSTRAAGMAAALVVLTTSCGARWTDDQRAQVERIEQRPTAAATPVDDVAIGATTTVAPVESAADPVAAMGPDATAPSPIGPAPSAPATSAPPARAPVGVIAGPLPCTAPSDAPGVTDTTITFGSISTEGGAVPGIGSSGAAAVRAYVAHRNATGGVCGRQLVVRQADDAGDNARYRSILGELEPQIIGLAGGLTIADDGSGDIFASTGLPSLASRSGDGVQDQPTVFDLNPPFPDLDAPIGKYEYLAAQGATDAALVYLAVDASRAEARTQQRLMEASGMRVREVVELPLSTFDYNSAARQVANSGAQYMLFIADEGGNGKMARAIADTGYDLAFADYFTFAYGARFFELAGPAADGSITWIRTLPNEETGSSAELAAFVDWMDRTAPGVNKDPFASESWVAVKALADGLEAIPGPISRQALVAALTSIDRYDADGMLGPIRLGPQENLGCFIGLHARDGRWERLTPAQGFVC